MYLEHEIITDDNLTQIHFHASKASGDLVPAHWHNHLEVLFFTEGKMDACINDVSYELSPGDILIVNPGDIHSTHVLRESHYYLLQIPPVHLERIDADWKLLHFIEYLPLSLRSGSLNRELAGIFDQLSNLDAQREKGYQLLFLIQIYRFLYLLYTKGSTRLSAQSRSRTHRDFLRIEQSMEYVRENYHRQLTLAEIACHLSLTPEYFCRLFKKYTGQTFFTYVNQVRLLHFYQDLLQTGDSITLLMERNGITNYKVFIRTFKDAYGTTPQRLRKQHKESIASRGDT